MAVTKISELKKYADGVEVVLPGWEDDVPFIAKLRRPSMISLAAEGQIPNSLMGAAATLFGDGGAKMDFQERAGLFLMMARASLVSPTLDELEEAGITLTDSQLAYIYNYSQTGLDALRRFREKRKASNHTDSGETVSEKAQ